MDEPTNHLDAESIDWLEQFLQNYEGTVIAVTHDRYFLDNVAGWILELDRGEGIPWKGNYSSWLDQKAKRLSQEEKTGKQTPENFRTRIGMGTYGAKSTSCKIQSRLSNYEKLASEDSREEKTNWSYLFHQVHV